MRYCKYLSSESGASLSRYALVEKRNGVLLGHASHAGPAGRPLGPHPRWSPGSHARGQLRACAAIRSATPTARHPIEEFICVGRNYRDHAPELGNEVPKEPILLFKPPSSLLLPRGVSSLPAISTRVDYEGELGIVIARRCHKIGPDEDVRPYIRGYVCVNDVTARDIQKPDGQWTRGKGFDTFCPVGPIVSDEIDPVGGAPVTVITRLNGVVKQQGSTRDLIFPIAELLRYITQFMTLEPGDLIPTGTPAGVGAVKPGDRIQIEIDGLGVLENEFAAE